MVEYYIEKILAHRTNNPLANGYSKIELEIKWQGYDNPGDDTWENLKEKIEDVPDMVHDYFKR